MTKLKNQIVFITGASSGIGKACAEQCASQGAHLILSARRYERLEILARQLEKQYGIKVLCYELDVTNKAAIDSLVTNLPHEWKTIDILINNAGVALTTDKLQDGDPNNWDIMIKTNVSGLLYVTHAILPGMVARNQGHIINIGSVAGHATYPAGNVYSATKHAVKAITQSLRLDLLGKAIRVTEIDPGAVHTEFSEVRWQDKKRSDAFYQDFTPLTAEDVADATLYSLTRPSHVNIAEIVIYPTDQASVNFIHRKDKN